MHDDKAEGLVSVEERISISKPSVVTGRVRVRTETESFEAVARAELNGEQVEVARVPINREIATAPATRIEGDVTIVPILEEIVVVEKRLVLKEEIHIRRRPTHEVVEVPVTLRRQRAVVERTGSGSGDPSTERTATSED